MQPAEEYIRSVMRTALGRTVGNGSEAGDVRFAEAQKSLGARLLEGLTAVEDADARIGPRRPTQAEDVHDECSGLDRDLVEAARVEGRPELTVCRWPWGRPFALLLSHDIDQVYDRELFRVLADVNHMRRMLVSGEPGHLGLACRRVARALVWPKRTTLDFETILRIEKKHGFRSTFFLLHDRYFARQGARFNVRDRAIGEIVRMILDGGNEVGVHGGYYRFNNAVLYRESREKLAELFGVEPVGIRNHLLRFSYPDTWRAQAEAGFEYDATYGFRTVPGARSRLALPFFAYDQEREERLDLVELPLTVMDTTIFHYFRLQNEAALDFSWSLVNRLARHGGLITLLWHNNFFNEPEYRDHQTVYEGLLERLQPLEPWCATGAEINRWWRARAAVETQIHSTGNSGWVGMLLAPCATEGLTLRIVPPGPGFEVKSDQPDAQLTRDGAGWQMVFPRLKAGERVRWEIRRAEGN